MWTNQNYVYIEEDRTNILLFGKCIGYGFANLIAWIISIWYLLISEHCQSALIIGLYTLVVQTITFKLYYDDHIACIFGKNQRIPEDLLHLFTLLGGGPAGTLAMLLLSHKVQNSGFQKEFMLMSLLSLLVIIFVSLFGDKCIFALYKIMNYATFGLMSRMV